MSTKTLRKRIALATVAALGAGVLSLVSTSVANAAASAAGDISSVTTGSTGVLASSNINVHATTTATASLLSTGSLVVTAYGADSYFSVSSGAYISAASASSGTATISADQTNVTCGGGATGTNTITITPTGASGSTFAVTGAASSTGSAVTILTVTIVGTSAYGVPSAAKSYASWSGTATNGAITADVANANSATTGNPLYLQIDLRDAYGNAITTAGALTVTASAGANVNITNTASGSGVNAPSSAGKYTTAVFGLAPATSDKLYGIVARVDEATAGAGWSGTVTVAYNGTTIATKSGTITGQPSKLTVTPGMVLHTNTQGFGAFSYQAYDSAGNVVVVPIAGLVLETNSNPNTVASAAGQTVNATDGTLGDGSITGGNIAGTSDLTLSYTRTDGVKVISNKFTVKVSGAAASYTATLDKKSYAPGDVATLKIKFLDSKGNLAATDSAFYSIVNVGSAPYSWNASVTAPQMTQVGSTGSSFAGTTATVYGATYPTSEALYAAYKGVAWDDSGTLTFKYTVGTTEGNFNAIVDFPSVDAVAGSAQTVSYSISSGSTSLNDVLKGIVDLIASINKQIAALAKLVTKKK